MSIRKYLNRCYAAIFGIAALGMASSASAVSVGVDPANLNLGYMNVFELPANGSGFVFGSPWGFADLTASYSGSTLTLGPNSIADPDPFWYVGGGGPGAPGNKEMHANSFAEAAAGVYAGQTLDFSFNVLSNTTTSAHNVYAFILDFNSDFSFNQETLVEITGPGVYNLSQLIDQGGATQYGFRFVGENVWSTDVGPFGTVEIAAVPVPAAVWLFGSGLLGLVGIARRKMA